MTLSTQPPWNRNPFCSHILSWRRLAASKIGEASAWGDEQVHDEWVEVLRTIEELALAECGKQN